MPPLLAPSLVFSLRLSRTYNRRLSRGDISVAVQMRYNSRCTAERKKRARPPFRLENQIMKERKKRTQISQVTCVQMTSVNT